MSYLASFLSRSAIVSPQQVYIVSLFILFNYYLIQVLAHLNRLSSWAHTYVKARDGQDSGLDFMYTDLAR